MPASGTYPHTRGSSDIRDNLALKFDENSFLKTIRAKISALNCTAVSRRSLCESAQKIQKLITVEFWAEYAESQFQLR